MKNDYQKEQEIKKLKDRLADLVVEAKKINQEIDEADRKTEEEVRFLGEKIKQSAERVDRLCSELDEAEKKAGDEFDRLALEQARDLAKDD